MAVLVVVAGVVVLVAVKHHNNRAIINDYKVSEVFEMKTKRQGVVVWFQNRRNIKQIKRFGHLIYTSKRLHYAVLYVNQNELEGVMLKLKKMPFVSKVTASYKPFIRTNFDKAKPDIEKKDSYNMHI